MKRLLLVGLMTILMVLSTAVPANAATARIGNNRYSDALLTVWGGSHSTPVKPGTWAPYKRVTAYKIPKYIPGYASCFGRRNGVRGDYVPGGKKIAVPAGASTIVQIICTNSI
jgi:hypothetical protein